jgi:hypothetical protein
MDGCWGRRCFKASCSVPQTHPAQKRPGPSRRAPATTYGNPEGLEPHQEPDNARRCPTGWFFCRSALVRDQPTKRYIPALLSRTSALLQGCARLGSRIESDGRPFLCGSAPCARQTYRAVHPAWLSRTSALLQGCARLGSQIESDGRPFCGSAPCARQTYRAVHPGVAVAHRVRSHRQAGAAVVDGLRLGEALLQGLLFGAAHTSRTKKGRGPLRSPGNVLRGGVTGLRVA